MDCRTALDILEVVRPGLDEGLDAPTADAELADALAHVEDCDDCVLELRHRQELDRRIGRVMRDVRVPAGLKDRLHRTLRIEGPHAADTVEAPLEPDRLTGDAPTLAFETREPLAAPARSEPPAPAVRPERAGGGDRRRWARVASMAAAVVLLAVGVWLWNRDAGPRATLAQLYQNVPLDLSEAEPFDGRFEPMLPPGWMSRLAVDGEPKGSDLGLGSGHVVALYRFRFRGRDRQVVEGVLAVAPAGSIRTGPLPTAFAGANTDYPQGRTLGGRQVASRSWSSGEVLYVCFVPADYDEQLGQLLYVPLG